MQVVDEGGDLAAVVGTSDADGVQGAGVAQGDLAVVDLVGADAGMGSPVGPALGRAV